MADDFDPDDPHGFNRPPSISGKTGYKKPPRKYRWPKGTSGNPKGRPNKKEDKNRDMFELAFDELQEEITVQENGVSKTITKRKAIVKQMVNKAIAGDKKAMEFVKGIDEVLFEARVKKETPQQGGVLLVYPPGMPSPAAAARGLTYEQELAEQQAPYRTRSSPKKDPPKDGEKK
jgi:hypothetical protein